MRLFVAEEGVLTIAATLTEEYGIFTPWVLGRFTLENASLAWWLLEPDLSTATRVARALIDRAKANEQQAKTAGLLVSNPKLTDEHRAYGRTLLDHAEQRLVAIRADAELLSLAVREDDKARIVSIGEQLRPNRTDLISGLLGPRMGPPVYRLLTEISHGESAALGRFYGVVPDADPEPGCVIARPRKSLPDMAGLALALMVALVNAADRAVAYLGWDGTEWAAWKRHLVTVTRSW